MITRTIMIIMTGLLSFISTTHDKLNWNRGTETAAILHVMWLKSQ